ncbi:MAG: zinc ABC transporter substrate-binding protein [bacterium]|nr:zinc ABC transporter substrate-binding protein [Candidatus Kapabacteria bacterium]
MKQKQSDTSTLITYIQVIVISITSIFFFGGCDSKTKSSESNGKLKIVTTTGMIKDAVEHVLGDKAEVIALMGPGVDPHLYKATQGDLAKLSNADIVLYNGLHLEGKMVDVLEKLARQKSVVAVADGVEESALRSPPEFKGSHDPHIWFDVKLWTGAVRRIAEELKRVDSAHASDYERNATAYIARLDSLDAWVRTQIATIPREQRVMITAHDAFGYFGRAYDIEVRGLQGISTVSEFGLADVAALVNEIVDRKIKAVFVESSVPKRSIEAVVAGVQSKKHDVKIGGQLYSDAMGDAGTPEGTYIGMVSANVNTIVNALK